MALDLMSLSRIEAVKHDRPDEAVDLASIARQVVADINNASASAFAGAIIGALYLKRFVTNAQDWVHIDLFAWNPKDRPGRPVGAEAHAVRALHAMIAERYA